MTTKKGKPVFRQQLDYIRSSILSIDVSTIRNIRLKKYGYYFSFYYITLNRTSLLTLQYRTTRITSRSLYNYSYNPITTLLNIRRRIQCQPYLNARQQELIQVSIKTSRIELLLQDKAYVTIRDLYNKRTRYTINKRRTLN